MTHRPALRVIFLDHCAQMSGGEIALARLLEALTAEIDAHVILGEDGPFAGAARRAGATVQIMPMSAQVSGLRRDRIQRGGLSLRVVTSSLKYVVALARELRRLRPDVVHTNSLKSALYGGLAARAVGVPVVWHIRDRISNDYLPTTAVHLVRGLSLVLPTRLVVNSRATAQTLPRASIVVHDIVPPRPSVLARPANQRPGGPLVVGMMGRLSPWKGQDVFISAFDQAARTRNLRARLIGSAMFGEEDYEGRLREQVDALGLTDIVEFRGFRQDIWTELSELDILVHASVTPEPFGQVVIEGMAAGLPVIAADAGGPSEIVTSGRDGLLVPPGDIVGLSAAIGRLADEPDTRLRLSREGLVTSASFAPEKAAKAMTAIFASVRRGPRRTRSFNGDSSGHRWRPDAPSQEPPRG